jgi:hypothetical protein
MTPQQLVNGLHSSFIDGNLTLYRDIFLTAEVDHARDPYWKRALALFNSLTEDQRTVFFEVMRQTAMDTTASVLGVLDGVSSIEGVKGEVVLASDGMQKLRC